MGIALFCAYALGLFIISRIKNIHTFSEENFFLNARNSSSLSVAISIVTSCVGASATMGVIGLAFYVGMPALWWLGSGAIGLVILGYCFASKVRATNSYILSDIIASLLGDRAEKVASLIIVLAWTAIVTSQLAACAYLISALLGINNLFALLLGCVLVTSHTVLSGQAGIIRLDKFQASIILGGLLTILIWSMQYSPNTIQLADFELINKQFPISQAVYFLLILGGGYIVCPMLYGRVLSAKSEKAARSGVLVAALALAVIAFLIVMIGIYAQGLIPQNTPSDRVLITLLSTTLHPWLALFIYLFLLSCVVSSADACLFAASSALSRSLLKKSSIKINRYCTIILMFIAFGLTFTKQGILDYLLMANNIYVCSVVIPIIICFLFHRTASTIHQTTMLMGMIMAGLLGLFSALSEQYYVSYIGLTCSLMMSCLSLLLKKYFVK